MAKKEDRFKVIYKEGPQLKSSGVRQILVDKKNGCELSGMVNRLCRRYFAPA